MAVHHICCTILQPVCLRRGKPYVRSLSTSLACPMTMVFRRRWKRSWNSSWLRGMARLAIIGCLVANLCVTALLTITSMRNYPGGVALRAFNEVGRRESHTDGVSSLEIKVKLISYYRRYTSTPLQLGNPIRRLPLSSRIFFASPLHCSRVDLRQN